MLEFAVGAIFGSVFTIVVFAFINVSRSKSRNYNSTLDSKPRPKYFIKDDGKLGKRYNLLPENNKNSSITK